MNENIFPDEEMKMPEEQFGEENAKPNTPYLGIVLGILILILLAVLGGLYMWSKVLLQDSKHQPIPSISDEVQQTVPESTEPVNDAQQVDEEVLPPLSTSDEIGALEADLDNTNLDEIDAELESIEAELDAALQ